MQKIRKNDIIQVVTGKDKGKKGKVVQVLPEAARALVEGINLAKKHKRQTRQDTQGGIVSIEMPIAIANIMLVCKHFQFLKTAQSPGFVNPVKRQYNGNQINPKIIRKIQKRNNSADDAGIKS